MRTLLRAFLSPAVADRYASALQPIAVADRDAALAGAVSTLRARFFVLPEELAVALVEDAGWSVADASTMLGLPTPEVRTALREAGEANPRVGASPPADLAACPAADGATGAEALLSGAPAHRRDAGSVGAQPDRAEPVDVELSTSLPGHVGLPDLEARVERSDRIQRTTVNLTVIGIIVIVALALVATRPTGDDVTLPDDPAVDVDPTPAPTSSPAQDPPTPTPSPTTGPSPALPIGPPVIAEARFVASVDPTTGDPGPGLGTATTGADPRIWLRMSQMPAGELVVEFRFTAPSGRSTARPVLIPDRTPLVSVRLPDELGRAPGRYTARIEPEGGAAELVELQLTEPADGSPDG